MFEVLLPMAKRWEGAVYEEDGKWWYDVRETFDEIPDETFQNTLDVARKLQPSAVITREGNMFHVKLPRDTREEAFDSMAMEMLLWGNLGGMKFRDLFASVLLRLGTAK
ncbi:MAG: hypothetical protein WC985_09325 [Thermoplasmata archaeon]